VGQGPHPQVTRGAAIPPIDAVANVLAILPKILLWNWRFANHSISATTEQKLEEYLDAKELPAFEETRYQLNQYAPVSDLRRLVHNHQVAWPYRLLLGTPITLVTDVLLPGRIFPWGDYFNPFTNTVHLYSDLPPVALHEAGHAYDFATRRYKGTYAAIRLIPFVDLYQEYKASDYAIQYFIDTHDQKNELAAYKILWPAYGTYAGSYIFAPIGTIAGALIGHGAGRVKVAQRKRYYQQRNAAMNAATTAAPATPSPSPTPAASLTAP